MPGCQKHSWKTQIEPRAMSGTSVTPATWEAKARRSKFKVNLGNLGRYCSKKEERAGDQYIQSPVAHTKNTYTHTKKLSLAYCPVKFINSYSQGTMHTQTQPNSTCQAPESLDIYAPLTHSERTGHPSRGQKKKKFKDIRNLHNEFMQLYKISWNTYFSVAISQPVKTYPSVMFKINTSVPQRGKKEATEDNYGHTLASVMYCQHRISSSELLYMCQLPVSVQDIVPCLEFSPKVKC